MDREDIQGIVLHGYRREHLARYHLLTFGAGDPRRALTRLVSDVSSADEPRASVRQNAALTASGLRGLGLAEPEMLQFAREFRQGMAHAERSLALGDVADESPEHWEFGGPNTPVIDALWMTFAATATQLDEASDHQERTFERFGLTFQRQDAALGPEPGGLLGALQVKSTTVRAEKRRVKRAPLGELLIGERDAVGERSRGPLVPLKASRRELPPWARAENALNFGKNSSYLVLRKLELSAPVGTNAALLAEHVRRARGVSGVHAPGLVRRSRTYGAADAAARGLWFMALNADIRRQFELVQQCYFNAPRAGSAHEADPLVGRAPGAPSAGRLTRLRGGAYFFLPSLRALNYLAESGG